LCHDKAGFGGLDAKGDGTWICGGWLESTGRSRQRSEIGAGEACAG